MDIEKILNKRSNAVVTDGGGVETPVKPTSSQLDNGEIAVNYHKGTERLFIKNDNEEVVEFVSKDEVEANYYDKDDTDTLLATKANTDDLAKVATSGSYNDLSDKPTIQELATVKQIYALDATNPDYPSRIGKYSPFDITSVFGTISIVTHYSNGTEEGLSDVRAEGFTEAQYTIDNTTYISYYKDSKYYYLGIKVPFFIANIEQYGNDYTFGVIKFTSTQNGVFKVHSIGVTPSNCTITVNGVVTQSLMSDMVAVQVNEGDVVKVTTLRTDNYYVKIIGFVLEGNCGVSVFVNDAGYLTEHQNITGKADKVSNPTNGNFAALDSNGNLIDSGHKHSDYQPTLVSGTNIKTINDYSIVGSGDLRVGTITGIIMNGNSNRRDTIGSVDLGTVITGVKLGSTTLTPSSGVITITTTSRVTNDNKAPITSMGVYNELQNYEKKMSFTSVSSLPNTCVVNTYYRITSSKTSLAITLPSSSLTAGDTIGISFTAGSSITTPTISGGTIYKQDGWSDFFEANATYEIVALYDGEKWLVTSTKFKS